MLLFMLKLYRNKIFISGLAVLSVFLFGANHASAAHRYSDQRISYRTQLDYDLDGDHIPEIVTIWQCGYVYQVSIHFTTGRPKVRLRTYVTGEVAGLSFQTTDVNDDNKGDLVIMSATSIRPVAVWLNKGQAKFQKVSSWVYPGVGRYAGPTFRHRGASEPEPVGNVPVDRLPQAAPSVDYFSLDKDPAGGIAGLSDQLPFDSMVRQVPSRGPPALSRV